MSEKLEIHDLLVSWVPHWETIADEDVVNEYNSAEVLIHKGDTVCIHGFIGRHEMEAKHLPEELRNGLEAFVRIAEEQRADKSGGER